ncbi:MAG: type IV toxin-antitoxin system AbiEi family antitoxin domain-containing protein [Candidatus Coatesbacteria bacterium]
MLSSRIVSLLNQHRLRFFTTTDAANLSGLSPASASQALRRMAATGLVARLRQGVWQNRLAAGINPFEAVPFLRYPWPAYVSLYSALSEHGIIEEIPQVVYAVSPGRPGTFRTPSGVFHLHHLPTRLIWGFTVRHVGAASYPMAEPEKAFLDLCYLALTIRSPLGFPRRRGRRWELDGAKVLQYAKRFAFHPLVDYVRRERFVAPNDRIQTGGTR